MRNHSGRDSCRNRPSYPIDGLFEGVRDYEMRPVYERNGELFDAVRSHGHTMVPIPREEARAFV